MAHYGFARMAGRAAADALLGFYSDSTETGAVAMELNDASIQCANCERRARPGESIELRLHRAGRELYWFCPECAEREFAADAPASGQLPHLPPSTPSRS